MNFDRSDEDRLLDESVRRFLERDYDFESRRRIIASAEGWSRDVWASLADLGVLGLSIPEEFGGFGGGAREQSSVMAAFGDALLVEPYLATVGVAAQFVVRAGSPGQRQTILPAVAAGKLRMAFAHTETGARYDLAHVATRARRVNGAFIIDGTKRVVLHAPCADLLVVSARLAGEPGDPRGLGLFLVKVDAPGVSLHGGQTLDELPVADIAFDQVGVAADARIGDTHDGLPLIEAVIDHATALVCAEAVGALGYASRATLDYLKMRRQFGVPIGTFQALQHRMVDMTISHEQAKSMAALACASAATEADPTRRAHVVSAAKVRIADACRHVSQEAIQLHGGMGMSDELKISHTFRRLTMIAQQFGDAEHHLERFAATEARPFGA